MSIQSIFHAQARLNRRLIACTITVDPVSHTHTHTNNPINKENFRPSAQQPRNVTRVSRSQSCGRSASPRRHNDMIYWHRRQSERLLLTLTRTPASALGLSLTIEIQDTALLLPFSV